MQTPQQYLEELVNQPNAFLHVSNSSRLPITILASEGEVIEQIFHYRQLGYEPIIIPTIKYDDRSSSILLKDTDTGNGYIPDVLEYGEANGLKEKVRSLRMSWMLALDVAPVSVSLGAGRFICERRAIPLLPAKKLVEEVAKVMAQYPDTEVIRLFCKHSGDTYTDLNNLPECNCPEDNTSVPLPAGEEHTRLSPACDGSYALYIADNCSKKVSSLFRHVRMPVDTALEYAAAKGTLKVRTLTFDAFIRHGGPKVLFPGYKYCVQLSSYSRPMQLLQQITALKEQISLAPKGRVHINVVLRGYDKATFDVLKTRIDLELSSCSHKVHSLPNRTQLLNFAEVPKGFDYYIKMDDDDYYDALFLKTTMEFHDKLPQGMCSIMSGSSLGVAVCMRSAEQDRSIVRYDITGACENTLTFSSSMLDALLQIAINSRVAVTVGKATDAIPMRTLSNSLLGLNRFEYWKYASILAGRSANVFAVLNYEGNAHATGQSNYGAFAVTAGGGAAEYFVRVFDTLEYYKEQLDTVRCSFSRYKGIDVAIVTDAPGHTEGMYVPMSTSWCSPETSFAQPITDIVYDDTGVFIMGFKFTRSGREYIYEPKRGLMVAKDLYDSWDQTGDFYAWVMTLVNKGA